MLPAPFSPSYATDTNQFILVLLCSLQPHTPPVIDTHTHTRAHTHTQIRNNAVTQTPHHAGNACACTTHRGGHVNGLTTGGERGG